VTYHRRQHHNHNGHRHWAQRDSSLCAAFLDALALWVLKHHDDPEARIILPTGIVNAAELMAVLRALEKTRSGHHV
jgi:hypothetical protein